MSTSLVRLESLRLAKEKCMYEKEAKQQEEKIERMKSEGGDEYLIKKQTEILQESRMMIPDCHRRLEAAHIDLSQILGNPVQLKNSSRDYFHKGKLFATKDYVEGLLPENYGHIHKPGTPRKPEENEKDLEESEEYKDARAMLDSVKLEA